MEKLLVDPLQSADISPVIVIDALDEHKNKDPESAILLVLGQSILEIPKVKVLITSWPERCQGYSTPYSLPGLSALLHSLYRPLLGH